MTHVPTSHHSSLDALERRRLHIECVTYCAGIPLGQKRPPRYVSIYSFPRRAQIYVCVTDHRQTLVRYFTSAAKDISLSARREGLPVADMNDAFAVAEQISRQWPVLPDPVDTPPLETCALLA